MMQSDYATFNEIMEQTIAWQDAIFCVEQKKTELLAINLSEYQIALAIGCGSTYYLSLTASSLFQSLTGINFKSLPSSELLLFPEQINPKTKTLLFAISRSGTTSETLHVVRKFKQNKSGDIIVITNYPNSPMALEGDISISIKTGQEMSIAQTKSFSSMLVSVISIAHLLGSRHGYSQYETALVDSGNSIFRNYSDIASHYGKDSHIKQVFFLGSGPRYGLACEASLKLKEMSQTVAEPFHFLEFRHGPISMIDEDTLLVGLVSESAYDHEMAVLDDAKSLGARTFTLGENGTDVQFNSGLPESVRDVLYMPVLQLIAYQRAINFGKNPDIPRNLTAVVTLDL
jgi:glutamine---fructose-6-phosphate transaminase (isomerizing)